MTRFFCCLVSNLYFSYSQFFDREGYQRERRPHYLSEPRSSLREGAMYIAHATDLPWGAG